MYTNPHSPAMSTASRCRDHAPTAGGRPRDRLTISAGWMTLVICLLHTLVFAPHPYWVAWLAGPFRGSAITLSESTVFWALPGGFVLPGILFGVLVIRSGRRGESLPAFMGWVLGLWALGCIWVVGPSGFMLVLVPAALLVVASLRDRRRGRPAVRSSGADQSARKKRALAS